MEMIDYVFDQIRKDSHAKKIAETVSDRVKHILAKAMPEDYDEIDIPVDELINVVTMVRSSAKKSKDINGNYQILKEMLTWQKRFYMQSDSIDVDQLLNFSRYIKDHYVLYKAICDALSKQDKFEFKHNIDLARPLSVSIKSIDEYCDSLKIAVKALYKMVVTEFAKDCKGFGPFFLFHAEMFGDDELGNKTLTHWFACYEVYTRCHVKKEKKADIIRDLDASPLKSLYDFNLKGDMSNASAKLTTYIDEAERLIASAERGTFPY